MSNLKRLYKNIFIFLVLILLIVITYIYTSETKILKPKINEETANYISLNNSNSTDILKISNLEKMSDKKGKTANDNSLDIKIKGKQKKKFSIVLYPINNKSKLEKIKFLLSQKQKEIKSDTLVNMPTDSDGGIIVYQGEISKNNSFTLSMWLGKNYHKNSNNISFEVKVKPYKEW